MLKKVVTCVILYWVTFVIAMTVIFCVKDAVPDTLIQFGLGGGAVELVLTAIIEISKKRYEHDSTNLYEPADDMGINGQRVDAVSETEFFDLTELDCGD